jgi:hypothetical protein
MFYVCVAIFALALGVRLLHWQDNRQSFPFMGMTGEYKYHAMLLVEGHLARFWHGNDPPSDANTIKHPPGYPLLMAAVYALFGDSDKALRAVHIIIDSLSAVLVVLVAAELFPFAVAVLAGLFVALSPQLAYHSIMLLPDPLATPPLLVALLLLIRAARRPRISTVAWAGVMVGISCWLRSNAMLLPFFLAVLVVPFLFARGRRMAYAAVLVAGMLASVAPITIRNYLAFGHFIPLSLSAGITLVEGIGIYDEEKRFGLPSSDYEVTKWEAEEFKRPDYLGSRFHPDGIERERHRLSRGFAVIRSHPLWFFRLMAYRGINMLRLARVDILAPEPAVTRSLALAPDAQPAVTLTPPQLDANAGAETSARTRLAPSIFGLSTHIESEDAARLLISPPMPVEKKTDYLLRLPLKIKRGSLQVEVVDAESFRVLASTPILHPVHWLDLTPASQPFVRIDRPFVSDGAGAVRVVLKTGAKGKVPVVAEAGSVELFALGASAHTWTRIPRLLLRSAQRLFLTAAMLPLLFAGIFWMARERRFGHLALLAVIPVYYMCVQSALWSEFRYVLPMYYTLFILAAAGLYWLGSKIIGMMRGRLSERHASGEGARDAVPSKS